ncbi:MAG TPA: pilus assembly protein TadG-related protein, partial [Candidatus Baltobacteraceae bacterium]|nr:pilus assembly protein TadG-related protein [Candidatus Baltobacteraceae bacterium]
MPILALGIIGFFGITAFGVDVGVWRYQQRLAQTASDSAAIAGAIALEYSPYGTSGYAATVTTAAQQDSATNGFTNGVAGVTVSVNPPPLTGPYTANDQAVEVLVKKPAPSLFAGYLGVPTTISARSVAVINSGKRACIYALATSGNSVDINGSTVNIGNCGIASDGNSLINGSTVTAGSITYVGSSTVNGSTVNVTPEQTIAFSDPCMTVAGCASLTTTAPTSGGCAAQSTFSGGSGVTIQPGTYCAILKVNGVTNVTFASGTYVLEHGLLINGCTNVSGSNVTFYNEAGTITINGVAAPGIVLTAPTTGSTAGVLFYQVASDAQGFTYNGTNGSGLAGMLYFPTAAMTLNGSLSSWLLTVGSTITINGSS